jgi:hypothetical protein
VNRTRRFDGVSFVIGVAFVTLGVVGMIGSEDLYATMARFVAPIALMGIGLAVLTRRNGHAARDRDDELA